MSGLSLLKIIFIASLRQNNKLKMMENPIEKCVFILILWNALLQPIQVEAVPDIFEVDLYSNIWG